MEMLNCPIKTLREYKKEIEESSPLGDQLNGNVSEAILSCIHRLLASGFVEVTEDELSIHPLPKVNFEEQKTNIIK